jgi:hypothetical protein
MPSLQWISISNLYSGNSYHSMVEGIHRQTAYRLEVWWSYDHSGRPVGRVKLSRSGVYLEPIEHWNNAVFEKAPVLEAQEWAEDFMLTPMDRLTLGLISK